MRSPDVRRRLDVEMVRRGIAATRSEAALAISEGKVVIGGRPAGKAGTLIRADEPIELAGIARRFVSRGGDKLDAALERFGVVVSGRHALDAGASTGGFTDCLLQRGAAHVVSVDVGYGQLDWGLRQDPRVTVRERTNVRHLRPSDLPYAPDVVSADLSFVSLRLALPALAACAAPAADFVLLVKPQFEAGREEVGAGGVVSDPQVWRRVLISVAEAGSTSGLTPLGAMASPLRGPAGNVEFLLHARLGGGAREDFAQLIEAAVGEGTAVRGGGGPSGGGP